jgi:hypothetical protein
MAVLPLFLPNPQKCTVGLNHSKMLVFRQHLVTLLAQRADVFWTQSQHRKPDGFLNGSAPLKRLFSGTFEAVQESFI